MTTAQDMFNTFNDFVGNNSSREETRRFMHSQNFGKKNIRNQFAIKVLSLVGMQLLVTAFIVTAMNVNPTLLALSRNFYF